MPESTLIESGLRALEAQLAQLPPDKTGALVAIADASGIRFGVVTRLGDGSWTASASVTQRWAQQRPDAALSVSKSW